MGCVFCAVGSFTLKIYTSNLNCDENYWVYLFTASEAYQRNLKFNSRKYFSWLFLDKLQINSEKRNKRYTKYYRRSSKLSTKRVQIEQKMSEIL
jgi:hypothetical protein